MTTRASYRPVKKDDYKVITSELRREIRTMSSRGHDKKCETKYQHPSQCCWKTEHKANARNVTSKSRWRAELTWIALGPLDQLVQVLEHKNAVTLKTAYQCYGVLWAIMNANIRLGQYAASRKVSDIVDSLEVVVSILEKTFNLDRLPTKENDNAMLQGRNVSDKAPIRRNKHKRGQGVPPEQRTSVL